MKLETFKSISLVFLIVLSLLLTLGIWNYHPDYDYDTDDRSAIEAKIEDGHVETKKSIIEPSSIIFHQGENHYGFAQKSKEEELYSYMQTWSLYDINTTPIDEDTDFSTETNSVEVIFPTEIPVEILQDIFTVDEEIITGRAFDRMLVMLNEDLTIGQLVFSHKKTDMKFSANIQNMDEVRQQINSFKNQSTLQEFLSFGAGDSSPIYVPREVEMYRRPLTAKSISKTTLRNVLFNNPSAVRSSELITGEDKYTDGQTAEMVVYDDYYMEYTNPTSSENRLMDGRQLINQTLEFVNDHEGWTTDVKDEYVLYGLDVQSKTALFRLTYDGIPVFERDSLSTIMVTLRNQNVYQYNRPLIQLGLTFEYESEKENLQTGQQVITFLQNSRRYATTSIEDVAIGYKIEEQSAIQYAFVLTPKWFINVNNNWEEIDFIDEQISIGGVNNAMGSN
ncbi:hypothetical protein GH741_17175 [Aquibacillus halophilus]|uniref:Regulatory protein YycH domain-containing protein n=1 Tax=Aquibacillus halophilus TaxID=930132 RepID=A0A6A8DF89_9BACI|nr:two-component system activity regulator YycH [Aquibacillus halophilus]MRH44378.1 hypothetical protein [Aquibacillus halophilus]